MCIFSSFFFFVEEIHTDALKQFKSEQQHLKDQLNKACAWLLFYILYLNF